MSNNFQKISPLPQRDTVTALQINTLLNVIATLTNMLAAPADPEHPHHTKPELDGGARSSMEASLIHTCARLDTIIEDASRWSFDTQNSLESAILKNYDQNLAFLKAQTAAAEEITKPHFKYRPTITRLPDGMWVAILGDLTHLDTALVGLGATPDEAVRSFDQEFVGRVPATLIAWLAKREDDLANGRTPEEFPKPEKPKDKNEKMDSGGPSHLKHNARKRRNPKRDSGGASADGEVGQGKD